MSSWHPCPRVVLADQPAAAVTFPGQAALPQRPPDSRGADVLEVGDLTGRQHRPRGWHDNRHRLGCGGGYVTVLRWGRVGYQPHLLIEPFRVAVAAPPGRDGGTVLLVEVPAGQFSPRHDDAGTVLAGADLT